MLPRRILQHVVQTISQLPLRPVAVMRGDCQQQQPIETVDGITSSVSSALLDKSFYDLVDQYKLTKHDGQLLCKLLPHQLLGHASRDKFI